jgi:hypothetical protein
MLAILSIKYEYEKTIFPLKIKLFFKALTVGTMKEISLYSLFYILFLYSEYKIARVFKLKLVNNRWDGMSWVLMRINQLALVFYRQSG